MTNEIDISTVLIDGEYATIMGEKYKRVEEPKTPVEEAYWVAYGRYPEPGFSAGDWDAVSWDAFQKGYEASQSKPMDEVVDRLVKKYQAQKLWNRVRDELGYSVDCVNEIVDLVEDWIPEYLSAAGSQNVDTELLVDGFNDCVRKMKEMLR